MNLGGYLLVFFGINSVGSLERSKKQTMSRCYTDYYGLLFNCSVEMELDRCVFKKIRQLGAKERLNYYDALTMDEKKSLIDKHKECLLVRENKPLSLNRNNVD